MDRKRKVDLFEQIRRELVYLLPVLLLMVPLVMDFIDAILEADRKRRAAEVFVSGDVGRAEAAAVMVKSNLPFAEWTTMCPNARLCKEILDRLTDEAHIIKTASESYRFRRTLEK